MDGGALNLQKKKICVVVGTRPEAIKLAPVIRALQQEQEVELTVVNTGQHKEMKESQN